MPQKPGLSATQDTNSWRLVGRSGPTISYVDDLPAGDRFTARFASDEHPGVRVVLTALLDGTLVSFGIHDVGTEAAWDRVDLALRGGKPPPMSGVPLTTRLIRSVPVAELVRAARAEVLETAELWRAGLAGESLTDQLSEQARTLRAVERRPGRKGHGDTFYAEVAVQYDEWVTAGGKVTDLAREMGYSPSALKAQLDKARRKGFLTDTTRGRAGGVATDKAKALLRTTGPTEEGE